jgi:hypothetical protein
VIASGEKIEMTIPNSEGFLSEASCLPCTPEEEKEIVSSLIREADSNMKDGDLYYLISHRSISLIL